MGTGTSDNESLQCSSSRQELGAIPHADAAIQTLLQQFNADPETQTAAILFAQNAGLLEIEEVKQKFNTETAALYDGVTRLTNLADHFSAKAIANQDRDKATESLRRMLITMIDDPRIVLIRLVLQIIELRKHKKQQTSFTIKLAQQTMALYSPLANRFGIFRLKWELEDIAFSCLHPDEYENIANLLAEKRSVRDSYIEDHVSYLQMLLQQNGITAVVNGRPKHLYSIWKKMHRKQVDFSEVYDVLAFRILVDNVEDCYTALALLNEKWEPIAAEFDDYIANPKTNNYQSIHSALIDSGGRTLEVQIKTHDMHRENEIGFAAHWRYKEDAKSSTEIENKVLWIRQMLAWQHDITSNQSHQDLINLSLLEQRIYALTPAGKIIDLPKGATVLDFAYAIHTEIGHRCRGGKIEHKLVPLTYPLSTGEQVEIITSNASKPSRDWLQPQKAYIQTNRARSKIQSWFKKQGYDENIAIGRTILEREINRLNRREFSHEQIAKLLDYSKTESMFIALANGELKQGRISQVLQDQLAPVQKELNQVLQSNSRHTVDGATAVSVDGIDDLVSRIAQCCNPLPGDQVYGYITATHVISIHRRDCKNLIPMRKKHRQRLLEIDWNGDHQSGHPILLKIHSSAKKKSMLEINKVLQDTAIQILAIDDMENHNWYRLTISAQNSSSLTSALQKIRSSGHVEEVEQFKH